MSPACAGDTRVPSGGNEVRLDDITFTQPTPDLTGSV